MVDRHLRHYHSDNDFNSLLVRYTPLIKKVVRSLGFYQKNVHHVDAEDAFQAGSLGLWFATMGYDSEKASFISHAYNCIRWEVLEELRRTGWSRGRVFIPINYEDFENYYARVDVEAHVIAEDWLEKIDDAVSLMDGERRDVYQAVMRHDGNGKSGPSNRYYREWGITPHSLSMMRSDIRKKLRVIH